MNNSKNIHGMQNRQEAVRLVIRFIFALTAVLFLWTAFRSPAAEAAPKWFQVNVESRYLNKGETMQIECGTDYGTTYKFSSSNKSVAKVTRKGIIKARKKGACYITITGKRGKKIFTARFKLRVYKAKLKTKDVEILQSNTTTVKIKGFKNVYKRRTVTWTTSDPNVATVAANGVITGTGRGSCKVYCQIGNSEPLVCSVKVTAEVLSAYSTKVLVSNTLSYRVINLDDIFYTKTKKKNVGTYTVLNPALGSVSGNMYTGSNTLTGTNVVIGHYGKYEMTFNIESVKWAAHRGYLDIAPENTVAAFRAACEAGAFAVETDARMTKDGVIVCFHDAALSCMTDTSGKVQDYDYNELRQIPITHGNNVASYPGENYIPTLKQYLEICKSYGAYAIIEMKAVNAYTDEDIEKYCRGIQQAIDETGTGAYTQVMMQHSTAGKYFSIYRRVNGAAVPLCYYDSDAYAAAVQYGITNLHHYKNIWGISGRIWNYPEVLGSVKQQGKSYTAYHHCS